MRATWCSCRVRGCFCCVRQVGMKIVDDNPCRRNKTVPVRWCNCSRCVPTDSSISMPTTQPAPRRSEACVRTTFVRPRSSLRLARCATVWAVPEGGPSRRRRRRRRTMAPCGRPHVRRATRTPLVVGACCATRRGCPQRSGGVAASPVVAHCAGLGRRWGPLSSPTHARVGRVRLSPPSSLGPAMTLTRGRARPPRLGDIPCDEFVSWCAHA